MFQDLFINATIIVAFISLANQFVFGEHNIRASKSLIILLGFISGVLGCILMVFSVTVTPNIIMDLRNIAIILASMFGGIVSSIIASMIIGIFRMLYYGIETSSIIAFFVAVCLGLGCPFFTTRVKTPNLKWFSVTLFSTIIVSIPFIVFIKDMQLLMRLLTAYWITNFLLALLLSQYLKGLIRVNRLYQKYKYESSLDFLTGLNNVREFDKIFNEISHKAIERKELLSLLFIDIDYFKLVNDTYGHAEGDVVLKELGNLLLKTCRSFDIVSRNGGEEFSVMLMACPAEQAFDIAERLRSTVEQHTFTLSNMKTISITISIGIATYPTTTEDIGKLIEQADRALYRAKRSGRNKVIFQEGYAISEM